MVVLVLLLFPLLLDVGLNDDCMVRGRSSCEVRCQLFSRPAADPCCLIHVIVVPRVGVDSLFHRTSTRRSVHWLRSHRRWRVRRPDHLLKCPSADPCVRVVEVRVPRRFVHALLYARRQFPFIELIQIDVGHVHMVVMLCVYGRHDFAACEWTPPSLGSV